MNDIIGIYIDIEGIKVLLRQNYAYALKQISGLVQDVYALGDKVYNNSEFRLLAYQFGDGIFIQLDTRKDNYKEILIIALVILQRRLLEGGLASAGIAQGEFADVKACFNQELKDALGDNLIAAMGNGLITITSVMGTALGNAVGLIAPRGPRLIFEGHLKEYFNEFKSCFLAKGTFKDEIEGTVEVNWLGCLDKKIKDVHCRAFGPKPQVTLLKDLYAQYIKKFQLLDKPGFKELQELNK